MFEIGPAWGSWACVRFCPPKEISSLLAFSQLRRLIIHWASAPLEGCPLWGPLHSNHQGVQTNVLKDSTSGSELGRACPLGRRTPPFPPCPPPPAPHPAAREAAVLRNLHVFCGRRPPAPWFPGSDITRVTDRHVSWGDGDPLCFLRGKPSFPSSPPSFFLNFPE